MLKSTFKKVSAIAIAGTMLAGMMAVPANAMSNETVYTPKNVTVLNETFDNYTTGDYKITSDDVSNPTIFSENPNIQYTRVSPPSWGDQFLSIVEETDNENYLQIPYDPGFHVNFSNPNGSTPVNLGDTVEVSFKFQYQKKEYRTYFNFNDAATRFTMISSTDTGGATAGNSDWASTEKGRFFTINDGHGRLTVSDNWDNGRNLGIPTTWVPVTATIKTQDADHEDKQTLTLESGGWKMVGYFDADYTGEEDTEYTPISSIDSLQVTRYGGEYGSNKLYLDDLKVSVSGTEAHNELVSDLSKTVLNETFDNLVNTTLPTTATSITGTSLQGKNVWGGSWTIAPDTVGGNAVAKITAGGGSQMAADFDDVTIGANDEIHVSYDRQFQSSWFSGINVKTDGFGANDSNLGTRLVPVDNTSIAGTGAIEAFVNGKLMIGVLDHGDCWPVAGETHHVEYVIKVSDPEYGNKQTLTYTISGGENSIKRYGDGNYSSSYKCVYYFDADSSDDEDYTKLTSLNNFGAYVEGAAAYTLDNLKVEVVKPGFEVVGVANTGNTYTFSGNDPIDLKYVVDASAASKVIVAQYGSDKRMIDATTENVSATDTVTVTPNPNAKTIKVMVLDMSNALPYTKAFVMTRQ